MVDRYAADDEVTSNTAAIKGRPDVVVATDGTAHAEWEDARTGNADVDDATLELSDASAKPISLGLAVKADGGVIAAWGDTRVTTSAIWGTQWTPSLSPVAERGHPRRAGEVTMRRLVAIPLAFACMALAGCENRYADVAGRIEAAGSPVIVKLVFTETNLAPKIEQLTLVLTSDATDDQVTQVWCEIAVPAGVESLPEDHVFIRRAGEGNDWLQPSLPLAKPACPPLSDNPRAS